MMRADTRYASRECNNLSVISESVEVRGAGRCAVANGVEPPLTGLSSKELVVSGVATRGPIGGRTTTVSRMKGSPEWLELAGRIQFPVEVLLNNRNEQEHDPPKSN